MIDTRPLNDAEKVLRVHGDMLLRLSLAMLGSSADAEDALQETMLSYVRKAPAFLSSEHERAWLIRVCANKCRDEQRRRKRGPAPTPAEAGIPAASPGSSGVLEALSTLPDRFRLVMTLHYCEGYSVDEIAGFIRRTPSAVKMRLKKGRQLLEEVYRGDDI